MPVITTLNFAGRTEEALNFYKESLDAEILFLMRFCDSPDQSYTLPGKENLIFHATYQIDGTVFMASDVGSNEPHLPNAFSGFALALRMSSVDRATLVFDALAEEGRIIVPLAKSAFTSVYGMVIDKFGIPWKVTDDQQIE